MKKILFILPWLAMGGLEKEQVTIANALSARGYDVTVMTLSPENDLLPELDKSVRYVFKPLKPHPIMKRIPYVRHKFYDDGMWETRASAKRLYNYYVGDEKYDVEIAFFRGLPIKIISGSTNKLSVKLAWVHNDFRKAEGYKNNFKSLKEVVLAYSAFDKVVCVSNEAKKGFIETLQDTKNLITVYNILPVKRIKELSEEVVPDRKKAEFDIVLVGRLSDLAKGQIRLINAVVRLKERGYDIALTLVGGGVDEQRIKDHVKEKNAEEYVFMVGNQINPYPYIARSDLLVCASYFEGFNLTVAEALILGVPVLSTDCAGPNEILDHGKYGMIVENSEDGLYSGIKELMDKPEKLAYYKAQAKKRVPFFDEEKTIKEITELF